MMKPAKNSLDIGVIVSDIKASLNFYQNILGLEFIGTTPLWFGTMHRLRFGTSDFKLVEPKVVPPRGAVGLENGFSLAGPKYYARFREVCAEMVEKYGVNYFKFDGIAQGDSSGRRRRAVRRPTSTACCG